MNTTTTGARPDNAQFVVRSFDDFKALVEKGLINTVDDIDRVIAATYPDGLKPLQLRDDFYPYIGFNLSRYAYTDWIAAELHAVRDGIAGKRGHSYGFPFYPRVERHPATDDRDEFYEVWTE